MRRCWSQCVALARPSGLSFARPAVGRRYLAANPALNSEVPSPERILHAVKREPLAYRRHAPLRGSPEWDEYVHKESETIRKANRVPGMLAGDRLPNVSISVGLKELMHLIQSPHYQRELLTLHVEGGECVRVLPQQVLFTTPRMTEANHVYFRRWPRDPLRHPVKLAVPLVFTHEETLAEVKAGGYAHDMFADTGLPCIVNDVEHLPRFIIADMRRSINGDLRFEHLDMPPGVTIQKKARTTEADGKTIANFLVGRVKRVRGG
mmetsp:Transcript_64454/g.127301  ORF Transcript_64454/g.127301 Transcript_64454/m.127301 type:complete len:264 (-) Transcript_64454:131-922(-)